MTKFENKKFKYDKSDFKYIEINGVKTKVYRIISKINIATKRGMIVEGEFGGYCALGSLSEEGTCWVDKYSVVGPGCFVSGNAQIEKSLLARDCTVGDRVIIKCSKIIPQNKVSIINDSRVENCNVKGDLNLKDSSSLLKTKVFGTLKMEGGATLFGCDVKAEGRGIVMLGNQAYANITISGQGTCAISENIKFRKENLEKEI